MSDAIKSSQRNTLLTESITNIDNYQNKRLTEAQRILKESVNKASLKRTIEKEKLNKKHYENLEGLMLAMFHRAHLIKQDSTTIKDTLTFGETKYLSGMRAINDSAEGGIGATTVHSEHIENKNAQSGKTAEQSKITKSEDAHPISEKKSILSDEINNIAKSNDSIHHAVNQQSDKTSDKIAADNPFNTIQNKEVESLAVEKKTFEARNELINNILKSAPINQEAGRQTIKYKFSTWGSSHEVKIELSNSDTLLAYASSDMVSSALYENQNSFDKAMYVYKDKEDNSNGKNSLSHSDVETDREHDN